MRKVGLTLLLAAALQACAGSAPIGGDPGIHVVSAVSLPAPGAGDAAALPPSYVVGALDKLSVDVFGIPELTGRMVQADASGRISLPLVGTVQAAGLTPTQIEALLRERLRANYVRNPTVAVNVTEAASRVITVDGEVKEPGMYPMLGDMTLVRAIASAKGVGEYAKLDDVVVFRTVSGKRYAALYNLAAIRRGAYLDPAIYSGDIIVVGDSPSRRLFRDILQAAPLLSTPLIIALQ